MRHPIREILVCVALGALPLAPVQALANETMYGSEATDQGPHIVELFLGSAFADRNGQSEQALSVGAQYRFAFNRTVSIGVLAEYAAKSLDTWVVGVPFVFNLRETGWQLTTMPGLEIENSNEEFLFRTGVGYEIEMQGYSLKPEVNVDWVDGETAVVAGVSIGFRF